MFSLVRLIPVSGIRRRTPTRVGGWPARRHPWTTRLERFRAALPAVCGIGIAAAIGWIAAGGRVPVVDDSAFDQPHVAPVGSLMNPGAVHVESTPSGARVRIDAATYGKTPLDVPLTPGAHTLALQHPDALDEEQPLEFPASGANVKFALWRRQPEVVPLRPGYPGATLVDASFLDTGQLIQVVNVPAQAGAQSSSRELWQLDPAKGQPARVRVPGMDGPTPALALAPDGGRVAYVTPGSSSSVTSSLWPTDSSAPALSHQDRRTDTVWLAPVDGDQAPRRVFALAGAGGNTSSSTVEQIVDLAWTPNGAGLVIVTRLAGPPLRSRILLLSLAAAVQPDDQPEPSELVLLPAEVLPGSLFPDPNGRWLALVAHAATPLGGRDLVTLCVLEIRPGGTFRDIADLGATERSVGAAPIAWPALLDEAPDRLVFVGRAPAAASPGGPLELFGFSGLFRALRGSTPPSGLFMANLQAGSLQVAQPRRLGTLTNTFGPLWRFEHALYCFARQDDGTLTLRSIDPATGAVHDLGVRLPSGVGRGTGLAVRWNARHGQALLLSSPPDGGTRGAGSSAPLEAWLVSFVPPSQTAGVPR